MSSPFDKFFKLPIYVHLLIMAVTACIVVFITLRSIDVYTNHDQAVYVPDIKGLQIEDAAPFLAKSTLHYEIIDSIYSKEWMPGAIVELSPEANSKVKKNRIIYITINAKTEETAPIPEITDLSYRQAYALLKAHGFANVEMKYISGDFRDLAIGVEYGGQMVNSGTRVPLAGTLILVISDGNILQLDSASVEKPEIIGGGESWF